MKPRRGRRRRRLAGPAADAGVALPTELVVEILERASPSAAVRCAATCRPWLRLVSRRSFVRRASRPRRALLLGFFVFDHADDDEQSMLQPRFVPFPGGPGPAGWRCPCIPRLEPRCLDMDLDPILSRNGYLVLSRVALAKPGELMPTAINYCVCNPATGSCYFLPPFHVDQDIGFWEYSCALLTGRDFKYRPASSSSRGRGSFELVVAGIPAERTELLVSVFSSRTRQWSSADNVAIPVCFIDNDMAGSYRRPEEDTLGRAWTYLEMHPRSPPAVCEGIIWWQCTCDGTQRVMLELMDLGGGQWSVTLLHLPNASHDFGLLLGCRDDGILRPFSLATTTTLTMWAWFDTRLSCGDVISRWRPSGEIDLAMAISEALGIVGEEDSDIVVGVKLLWYCEKSNVIVFSTAALGNFALDLDTKRADALGNITQCKSELCARYGCVAWRACPYEIDCPPHWITPK